MEEKEPRWIDFLQKNRSGHPKPVARVHTTPSTPYGPYSDFVYEIYDDLSTGLCKAESLSDFSPNHNLNQTLLKNSTGLSPNLQLGCLWLTGRTLRCGFTEVDIRPLCLLRGSSHDRVDLFMMKVPM